MVMQRYWAGSDDAHLSGASYAVAGLLRCGSWFYHAAWWLRQASFRCGLRGVERLPCAVLSIGNLTVGGAGKTPMTRAVAAMLQAQGRSVVVLSRGYRGRAAGRVNEVSNRRAVLMTPELAGDEPVMLARQLPGVPVLIGAQRAAAGRRSLGLYHPDVLLLDDGYQHQQLHRDCNLLLLSADRPLGNGRLLPRGPLREPLTALQRADGAIITVIANESAAEARRVVLAQRPELPVFTAHFDAVDLVDVATGAAYALTRLEGATYLAFCALARPERFRASLAALPGTCAGFATYADHYFYRPGDLSDLARRLEEVGGSFFLTTEKDAVKVQALAPLSRPVLALRMTYRFATAGESFATWLSARLQQASFDAASRGT